MNWTAVAALVGFIFLVIIVVASVSMGLRWNKIDFHEVGTRYAVIVICAAVAALSIGGGLVWLTKMFTDTAGDIAPGIQQQQVDLPANNNNGGGGQAEQGGR